MTVSTIRAPSHPSALHTNANRRLTGGRAVARALIENGVTDLFGIHGYINPVIEEACVLGARMWHFRHEQSAGFAADAYARILRRPGVCFASASAGMANYLGALSQGIGALSPMVLLVGQHGTAGDRLETLQEGYAADCFRSVAKWTHRCTDWELNAFWVRKALVDAMTYPVGPVVLEFPLNNQFGFGPQPQRKYVPGAGLPSLPQTQADPQRVEAVVDRLLTAKKPLLIAGDGVYWSDGAGDYQQLAEFLNIPASARRTARGAMPEDHALAYVAGYRRRLFEEADLIMLVSMRAGELESWFEAPDWPRGDVEYIQINDTPGELWLGLPSAHMLVGSAKLVLRQILQGVKDRRKGAPVERPEWIATLGEARTRYREVMKPLGCHVEHVEHAADLRPALQRALASGKIAVVNVVADTDGTGVSLPWLRLKIGEFYSRGIDDLPQSVLKHFRAVSPLEALRLQKTARDNGTNIDLAFMAAITGHSEDMLRALADKHSYEPE